MLESRQLLSGIVTTDQFDYAPGSTAIFTASNDAGPLTNFSVGETVHFHIDRTDGIPVNSPPALQDWNVTDGVGSFSPYQDPTGLWIYPDTDATADGSIGTSWYVDPQFAGASLELTATGQTSGVVSTNLFTDSSHIRTLSVGSQSPTNVPVGGTATFAITTTWNGNSSDTYTAAPSVSGLPLGSTFSFSPASLSFNGTTSTRPAHIKHSVETALVSGSRC